MSPPGGVDNGFFVGCRAGVGCRACGLSKPGLAGAECPVPGASRPVAARSVESVGVAKLWPSGRQHGRGPTAAQMARSSHWACQRGRPVVPGATCAPPASFGARMPTRRSRATPAGIGVRAAVSAGELMRTSCTGRDRGPRGPRTPPRSAGEVGCQRLQKVFERLKCLGVQVPVLGVPIITLAGLRLNPEGAAVGVYPGLAVG